MNKLQVIYYGIRNIPVLNYNIVKNKMVRDILPTVFLDTYVTLFGVINTYDYHNKMLLPKNIWENIKYHNTKLHTLVAVKRNHKYYIFGGIDIAREKDMQKVENYYLLNLSGNTIENVCNNY